MTIPSFSCSACGHRSARRVLQLGDHAFVRCERCSLVHTLPRPAPGEDAHQLAHLDDYARSTEHLAAGMRFHHDLLLARLAAHVPPPGHLLEIGSADGAFLARARGRGYDIAGLEPTWTEGTSPDGLDGCVQRSVLEDAKLPADHFDAIVAVQVIEHLLDPTVLVQAAARALRPGGIIYIETPNFDCLSRRLRVRSWTTHNVAPGHWHLFNPRSLPLAFRRAGLEVVSSWTFFKALGATSRGGWRTPLVAGLNAVLGPLGLGNNVALIARRPE